MKPRTVILTFEIVTNAPIKDLREGWAVIPGYGPLKPENKPKVDVVRATKPKAAKAKRR